jgi:hypothetical protein
MYGNISKSIQSVIKSAKVATAAENDSPMSEMNVVWVAQP